jgi:RNA polymerase nonessential primary-like sigma factor
MATALLSNQSIRRKRSTPVEQNIIRAYLRQIGRIPRLTPEEEITLGHQVKQMMGLLEAKSQLQKILKAEPTQAQWAEAVNLTTAELERILQRGERAKRRMIEANLRLVVSVAKKYQHRNLDLPDLIQEGSLGLERGVEKFDPTRGYKFSTYAYWWIRQGITRAIAEQSRTIRLPVYCTDRINKIKRTQRELSQTLGRTPTFAEIAQALNLKPRQVRKTLELAREPISLDKKYGENQDTELQELLEADLPSPEDLVVQKSLKQSIFNSLSCLTTQQKEIIILRYGLLSERALSLSQIGHQMGISRERVRQIEYQALKLLRRKHRDLSLFIVG